MPTQEQYNVTKQSIQNKYIRLEILNFDMQTVDELSGNCIGGNINIDATSDLRRSCSISLVINDKTFEQKVEDEIWLDKYIKIYVGIDSIATGDTVWFDMGIYIIDAPSYQYDAVDNVLSFSGYDLMSKLTGARDGYLTGLPAQIQQGSNVRQVIISALTQFSDFTKYSVQECMMRDGTIQNVPYDVNLSQGSTIYDILVAMRDIMPYYEMFFDTDGTFVFQQIPTGEDEGIIADDDLFNSIITAETLSSDFASVKNIVEVYGRNGTYGYAEVENEESPFYPDKIGYLRKVLFGGDYDNITSDNLAKERAAYELYLSTNLQDTISFSCVPAYFLDVNKLIRHQFKPDDEPRQYIIKSISIDLNPLGSMSINAIRYYPLYPYPIGNTI